MKKFILTLNIIISLIYITCGALSLAFRQSWLNIFALTILVALCAINTFYSIKQKSNQQMSSYAICAQTILSIIAVFFVKANFVLCISLFAIGQIAIMVALYFDEKFEIKDLFYICAIALPTILTFAFAPIFGYKNLLTKVLILLYMLITSVFLGKITTNFSKNKTSGNVFLLIAGIVLFIFNITMMLIKLSNVIYIFEYIFYALFYITQILFVILLFVKNKTQTKPLTQKDNLNKSFKRPIFVAISSFIIGYLFVSSLFCFNVASAKISKDQFLSLIGNNLNVPIIEISTQYNQMPVNKEDYVNCSFTISNCKNSSHNLSVSMASSFDNEDDNVNSVGIRLRGNSTRYTKKRPYRIKFEEKQSILGMEENKSWVLLADYYDQSYIRNYTAFTIADNFDNLDFSPTPHHVALVLNNEFKGLYLLCEQVDENKGRASVKSKFDVTKDTEFPFLVEMDELAFKEGITGIDNFYVDNALPVEIKYPESDERQATKKEDKVFDYIYEYINAVFKILNTGEKVKVSFRSSPVGLDDLVDNESAVDYYLINEIMLNTDSTIKSIYMHKTKDGLLKFGPVWDFDFSMTTQFDLPYHKSYIEEANIIHIAKNSVIFKHLIKDSSFYNSVATRYNQLKTNLRLVSEDLKNYKTVINKLAIIDSQMWHGQTGEFQFGMQYDYVRLFLQDRLTYLDRAFSNTHEDFLKLF